DAGRVPHGQARPRAVGLPVGGTDAAQATDVPAGLGRGAVVRPLSEGTAATGAVPPSLRMAGADRAGARSLRAPLARGVRERQLDRDSGGGARRRRHRYTATRQRRGGHRGARSPRPPPSPPPPRRTCALPPPRPVAPSRRRLPGYTPLQAR